MGGALHNVLKLGAALLRLAVSRRKRDFRSAQKWPLVLAQQARPSTFIQYLHHHLLQPGDELNNALIGIAIMLAMIGDAISDRLLASYPTAGALGSGGGIRFVAGACAAHADPVLRV